METSKKYESFNIIRFYGQVNKAQLEDGTVVERMDQIFIPEKGRFIKTAEYDEHFIYEVPSHIQGPAYKCTCGSFAMFAGPSAHGKDSSDMTLLFECYMKRTYGHHSNTDKTVWI